MAPLTGAPFPRLLAGDTNNLLKTSPVLFSSLLRSSRTVQRPRSYRRRAFVPALTDRKYPNRLRLWAVRGRPTTQRATRRQPIQTFAATFGADDSPDQRQDDGSIA